MTYTALDSVFEDRILIYLAVVSTSSILGGR